MSRDPRRRPSAASLATVLEAAADRLEAPASARVVDLHPRPPRGPRRIATPHIPRPSLRLPHLSLDRGVAALGAAASSLRTSGVPAPLAERACAIARRVGPAAAAAVVVEAVLRTFPFWPASLTTPLALACGGLAIVAPWSAALLVLAVCVPALGNLSSALAWAFALLGALWLSVSAGSGRRALLPALAPAALVTLRVPAVPDRGRTLAKRPRPRARGGGRTGRDRPLGGPCERRDVHGDGRRRRRAARARARRRGTARRTGRWHGAPWRWPGRSRGRGGASAARRR